MANGVLGISLSRQGQQSDTLRRRRHDTLEEEDTITSTRRYNYIHDTLDRELNSQMRLRKRVYGS